jgi:ABC-type sugar transport system substrate-binding protein
MKTNSTRSAFSKRFKYLGAGLLVAALGLSGPVSAATEGKIAYLVPAMDQFWRNVSKGVTETMEANGSQVMTLDSKNDASTQLKNAQDAIAQGVKGLVISPTDSSTAPTILNLAKKNNIPVVIADIGTNSGDYVSLISSNNEQGAYETGKALAADLKAKGRDKDATVGIVSISLARKNGKLRTDGFTKAMTEAGIKVVVVNQMQRYTADETFRYVQDMLTAHPQIRGIFVETDVAALGGLRALQAAHRTSDVSLVAFDGIPQFVDMLRNDTLVASGMQQPYLMGQLSAQALIDTFAGKTPEKAITVPILVVTKSNLEGQLDVIQKTVFAGEKSN